MRAALKLALGIGLATTVCLSGTDAPAAAAETAAGPSQPISKEATAPTPADDATATTLPPLAPTVKKSGAWDDINERMTRIERRIVEAVAAGRLGSTEAKRLRDDLDRTAEMQAVFRALPVTTANWHNMALSYELDQLTNSLERSMHDRNVVPTDLEFLKDDTLRRIDTAASQGRLNAAEVTRLKQEYNRITALEHLFKRQKGRLTYAEKLMLAIDLDHLSAGLRRQMSTRSVSSFDVNQATAAVEKRMDEAVKAGSITPSVAAAIKAQLVDIVDTANKGGEASKQDSKNTIALGLWIESVSNRLDEQVQRARKTLPSFAERAAAADRKVAQALIQGRLTPLEALELKEDLDQVTAQYDKAKEATPTLKPEEEFAFYLGLARLEGLVDRQLHGPSTLWTGMHAYQTHVDARIKEALSSTRLTASEAKSLDAAADFTAAKMRALGGLDRITSTGSALDLAIDLQQLSAKIDKSLKDRAMAQPDIDSLYSAIDKRIGDAMVAGQLNLDEGKALADKLSRIATMRDQYKLSDGALSSAELWTVAYELQASAADLEETIHDHPSQFPGLEVRRAQIDEMVTEGISSGRFSQAEADSVRSLLTREQETEKALRATNPGYTAQQATELVSGLESQHDRIQLQLRERQIPLSDLVAAQGQLERKIAQFFSLGYLTPTETERLRQQYDAIVSSLRHLRGAEGGLSYSERLAFLYGFERLAAATERNARTAPLPLPNLAARQLELEQKLGNALASGRLPLSEAMNLKALLEELTATQVKARTSGGGLSYPEALVAVADINRLSSRIDARIAALKQALPDIDTRQTQIEKRILEAKATGKLKSEQVVALKAELDRIAEGEVAFRVSEESLNFMEAINLVQELERVSNRLEQMLRTTATSKSGANHSAGKTTAKPKKNL